MRIATYSFKYCFLLGLLCNGLPAFASTPTSFRCQVTPQVTSSPSKILNFSMDGEVTLLEKASSLILFSEDPVSCSGTMWGKNYCALVDNSTADEVSLSIQYTDFDQSYIPDGARQDLVIFTYNRNSGKGFADLSAQERPLHFDLTNCQAF